MLKYDDDDGDTAPAWNGVRAIVNSSLVILIAAMLLWWPVSVVVEVAKQKWPIVYKMVASK